MKVLISNLGSTSLKYRLFDFSDSGEEVLMKGGFERVVNHADAIEETLQQLRDGLSKWVAPWLLGQGDPLLLDAERRHREVLATLDAGDEG